MTHKPPMTPNVTQAKMLHKICPSLEVSSNGLDVVDEAGKKSV